jgi:rhomboid family GlyGly-CTERM serine protease
VIAKIPALLRLWLLLWLFLALPLAWGGESWAVALRYERALLWAEPWRFLTGHWVHLGPSHLWQNLLGGVLITLWLGRGLPRGAGLWLLPFLALGVSWGLYWREPQLVWYVGLSGVLYGLLLAGVIPLLSWRRPELVLLFWGVLLKVGHEQWAGPSSWVEESVGGPVVVAAHLYGAFWGALVGALTRWGRYCRWSPL